MFEIALTREQRPLLGKCFRQTALVWGGMGGLEETSFASWTRGQKHRDPDVFPAKNQGPELADRGGSRGQSKGRIPQQVSFDTIKIPCSGFQSF